MNDHPQRASVPSEQHAFPADFAQLVRTELLRRDLPSPTPEVLTDLFELMYFASLRTEEGHPVRFRIAWMSPADGRIDPAAATPADHWSCVPLAEAIALTAANVAKIALASDPRTSALAVDHREGATWIWALTDQGNRYYDYLNYETEALPSRPGIFQASVRGPGHLVASIGTEKIGELKFDQLVEPPVDVLSGGPVRRALQPAIDEFIESVNEQLGLPTDDRWNEQLAGYWLSGLCRLLMRIDSYHHGGGVLITPSPEDQIHVKYAVNYSRLATALKQRAIASSRAARAAAEIGTRWATRSAQIPAHLYFEQVQASDVLREVQSEIDGALWFVSLLSRVDGAVVMTPDLTVRGFGAELTDSGEPERIYIARDAAADVLREGRYTHFGTRHRSMMRHCAAHPESVGFVMSQDRVVRAVRAVGDKLVLWPTIKLQRPMSSAEEDDPSLADEQDRPDGGDVL